MSDISYPPLADETTSLVARLARLRGNVTAWFWVEGLGRVLWLALALFAADLILDWLFRMDRAQRAVMLALMTVTLGWAIVRWLARPLSRAISDDALALQVESANRRLGQGLITALQLSRLSDAASRGMSPTLMRQAVLSGVQRAREVSFTDILDRQRLFRNFLLLLIAFVTLGCVALGTLVASPLQIWWSRNILLSNATWPQKTYLVVERVGKDGTVVFPRGEDWTQLVSVRPDSRLLPGAVYLEFRRAGGRSPLAMKRRSERQFEAVFAGVIEAFEFRARGGDAVTEWVSVEPVEPPAVTELKLIVTPPKYAGASPEELPRGQGPYYVLPGSALDISLVANKPLASASLVLAGKGLALVLDDPLRVSGHVAAADLLPGQYSIALADTLGLTNRQPPRFALRTLVDRQPQIRVRLIGVGGLVVPQARIPFTCRVTDDFGLTAIGVHYRWKGDDAAQPEGQGSLSFEQLADRLAHTKVGQSSNLREADFDDAIELAPLKVPPGTGLAFHFEATDNDDIGGPNIGRSSDFLVRVVTADVLRTDLLRREKEQRSEFERLVKEQEELITDSRALEAALKRQTDLTTEHKDQLAQYQKRQKLIGQNTAAIAERLAAIVVEVQNNRLEEDGGRLQTRLTKEIVEPMQSVAGELIPQAVAALDRARRQTDANEILAVAISRQAETAAKMKEILDHMVQAEGFQEAVNLLYEIQKAQTEVNEQTNNARQERIKRILEGAVP
jgi:hypothetical protein